MRTPERTERLERPDGCELELRVYNPAARRTLILSNGLGCSDVFWRHLLDDFATDCRVVTWDYRGQGGSTEAAGPGAYAVSAHAADLAAIQAQVGADRATHLGFGLGALIALEHHRWSKAAEVDALVLIQGGLPPTSARLPAAASFAHRLLCAAVPLAPWGVRAADHFQVRSWLQPLAFRFGLVGATCDRRDFEAYLDVLGTRSPLTQLEIARGLARHNSMDLLEKVRVPTLVFGSAGDRFCPEPLIIEVHDGIDGAEYVRLPGASHASLLELGPIIAGQVRRFLEG